MNAFFAVMMLAAAPAATPRNAPAAAPAFGWVIREDVALPGGQTGWQKTEIAFGKVRRETSQSREVVIVDPAAKAPVFRVLPGNTWSGIDRTVFDAGKTPGPFVDGIGLKSEGEGKPETLDVPATPFKATGKTAMIGEWEVTEYVSVAKAPGNFEVRVWLADRPAGIPNDVMLAIVERVYARKGNAWEAYFRGMKALGGFPVRTVYRFEIGGAVTEVVTTVSAIEKTTSLAESAFQIPAGSTRVDAPKETAR